MFRKLIFITVLFVSTSNFSNPIKNFGTKLVLFHLLDFSQTIIHEFGHAAIIKLRGYNPKIIIGNTKSSAPNSSKLINILSLNPQGVTVSDQEATDKFLDRLDKTKVNKNIIQIIAGPIFGILASIAHLKLLEKFSDKLSPTIANSLKNFIIAKMIGQFVYGFTPFDHGKSGDGAKLFSLLHTKFQLSLFKTVGTYQGFINLIRHKYFEFLIAYHVIYAFMKQLGKEQILEILNINNKYIQAINSYIKRTVSVQEAGSLLSQIKKQGNDSRIDKIQMWVITKLTEALVF